MAITETGLLAGAVGLITTYFGWMFKRQISRIDELEKKLNDSNVIRAEMAKDIKYLIDAVENHFKEETEDRKEFKKDFGLLHDEILLLKNKDK